MNDLTKTTYYYPTGALIHKYRKERGWTITENPKRGTSILQVIKERFGEAASPRLLKKETFKNLESQGSHHTEPTAVELYQIAVVLEVPLLALIMDYDTPHATSPFDSSKTIFEIAQYEGTATQEFRGFNEVRKAEKQARKFVRHCKKLAKLSQEKIKEDLTRNNFINARFWPHLYSEIMSLSADGLTASPKTYAYYAEAKEILATAGVDIDFILGDDLETEPWFIKDNKEKQRENEEEKAFEIDCEDLQQAIAIFSKREDDFSKQTAHYLEIELQEKQVQYLWNIGVDEETINLMIIENKWDKSLLLEPERSDNS